MPSAKRRGALRHQRSLVGLTAVVMGLLSITLALLYRASQQVRTHDDSTAIAPHQGFAAKGALPHTPTSAKSRHRARHRRRIPAGIFSTKRRPASPQTTARQPEARRRPKGSATGARHHSHADVLTERRPRRFDGGSDHPASDRRRSCDAGREVGATRGAATAKCRWQCADAVVLTRSRL